jgi:hypothetical protein
VPTILFNEICGFAGFHHTRNPPVISFSAGALWLKIAVSMLPCATMRSAGMLCE